MLEYFVSALAAFHPLNLAIKIVILGLPLEMAAQALAWLVYRQMRSTMSACVLLSWRLVVDCAVNPFGSFDDSSEIASQLNSW